MLYKILKPLAKLLVRIFFRVKVFGADNVPTDGAALICSNHISMFDFAFIAVSIKPQIAFLGKAEIGGFKPVAAFLKSLGFIPIKRGQSDIGAIKSVISTVQGGRSVLLFPQGTRKKGVLVSETAAKHGTALIQRKAGCPVIPVSVTANGMKAGIFKRINVRIGRAIPAEAFTGLNDADATKLYFDEIIRLSEE